MQLSVTRTCVWSCGMSVMLVIVASARAQDAVDVGTSLFHETGGPLHMTVLVPTAEASVDLGQVATLHAGWTADVVSGASVAVVDAPAANIDAITSATLTDTRHSFSGEVELHDELATLGLGYSHAFENDYLANAFHVTATTELFERNTVLELAYGRSFDEVCDVAGAFEPVMKPRMDTSDGCFDDASKHDERELSVHSFQASWSQAWTPILSTQLTASAQLLHGFQINPYRAVRIGKTAAQEHHPEDRARYALGAGARLWIPALSGALQAFARTYRDTWGITSLTGEGAYEQSFGPHVRLRVRGRYYTQTAAAFYSDDYVLDPRGQYFTGDRELSPMHSGLLGVKLVLAAPPNDAGEVFGFLSGLELTLKGDLLKTFFDRFHYDKANVPNDLALLGSVDVRALF